MRNADNVGREFVEEVLGGHEVLEKQGRKIGRANSLKILLRNVRAIFLKFARPRQKLKPNPLLQNLSGPVRDTPPYRAIPFRDSIAEGGIAPVCLVFKGYRATIAERPLLTGGYRTSTSHVLQGGNAQKKGRGYRTQLAMLRHQKPHSAQ